MASASAEAGLYAPPEQRDPSGGSPSGEASPERILGDIATETASYGALSALPIDEALEGGEDVETTKSVAAAASAGFVAAPALALPALPVMACVYHAALRASGISGAGLSATFSVYAYASAVTVALWIPFLGIAAVAYGYYLTYVGIREMHGASSSRTLAVVGCAAVCGSLLALYKTLWT